MKCSICFYSFKSQVGKIAINVLLLISKALRAGVGKFPIFYQSKHGGASVLWWPKLKLCSVQNILSKSEKTYFFKNDNMFNI